MDPANEEFEEDLEEEALFVIQGSTMICPKMLEGVCPNEGDFLVMQRLLAAEKSESEPRLRSTILWTRCTTKGKVCVFSSSILVVVATWYLRKWFRNLIFHSPTNPITSLGSRNVMKLLSPKSA